MRESNELLKDFIDFVSDKTSTVEGAKQFLNITQKYKSSFVNGPNVEPIIRGLYTYLANYKLVKIKEQINPSKVTKDFRIYLTLKDKEIKDLSKNVTLSIRMVKEIAVQKTSEDGEWGINISSLKRLK